MIAHVIGEALVDVEVLFAFALVALILVAVDVLRAGAATLLHAAVGIASLALVLAWWP